MENFTPVSALIGGVLIGTAASLLLWLTGRIAGISGILHGATTFPKGDALWRWLFIAGIILGAGAYVWTVPLAFEVRSGFPLPLLVVAGFLVGVGTQMGSGCTSGHGICGIARLSKRSILATIIFMASGVLTTYTVRHLLGVIP